MFVQDNCEKKISKDLQKLLILFLLIQLFCYYYLKALIHHSTKLMFNEICSMFKSQSGMQSNVKNHTLGFNILKDAVIEATGKSN